MKKNLLYGSLSIIIIAITLVVSVNMIKAKPSPQKERNIINHMYVKAEKVNLVDSQTEMVYRGRVTAFDQVSLAAEVQGKILKGNVSFKEGEHFRKNDLLLKIYNEDVLASVKASKSSFMQTLAKILPDLKMDFNDEYEKWNNFFIAIDVDKNLPLLPEIHSNKEKVFLAANNVLSSYYSLQQQEINIKKYTIRAPFNGSFKSVNKEIGAIASPGAELASIIRSDKLEITVPVFPADIKWIKKGEKVKISDNEAKLQNATISRISGFVDESNQSVNVYLSYFPTKESSLLQGSYVDINFNSTTIKGFEIPREALIDNNFVYELKDEQLYKIEVNIERQLNDSYIISGLETDQTIVTESLARIDPTAQYLAR